jgi:hypothetical protein
MGNEGGSVGAGDGREVAEELRLGELARADGRLPERVETVDFVLRRLHRDRVTDAVERVEPVVGRNLAAGAERDEEIVGDVALGEAHSAGPGAVDIDEERGRTHDLLEMDIDGAAHAAQPVEQPVAGPATWTSMGAGRPESSVWSTRPVGWVKKT